MNYDLPPTKPLFTINSLSSEKYKPYLVYLTHDIANKISDQLAKENITWDTFIQRQCVAYLNKKRSEQESIYKYISFSEMQLFEEQSESVTKIDLCADESSSDSEDISELFKK